MTLPVPTSSTPPMAFTSSTPSPTTHVCDATLLLPPPPPPRRVGIVPWLHPRWCVRWKAWRWH